jgi:thioredoxin 1
MIDVKEIKSRTDFSDFLEYNKTELHIVKFGADWCGPCKLLEQRIKNLDTEKIGLTLFGEISIDDQDSEEMEIAIDYGVSNIPVLIFFKNGEMVHKTVGALSSENLYALIAKYNDMTE